MTAKKTSTKKTDKSGKPRMSVDAARADGAAKVKAAKAAANDAPARQSAPKANTAKTAKPRATKPKRERRPAGLDLAAKVLSASKEPLNAKTIAERAIAAGWKTSGKTPHATLYAAIIREIADKGKDARFKKMDRGLFAFNSPSVSAKK